MPDDIFYVGALDENQQLSGLVPARFLTINGRPVVDRHRADRRGTYPIFIPTPKAPTNRMKPISITT
jgi:hypothetical protein